MIPRTKANLCLISRWCCLKSIAEFFLFAENSCLLDGSRLVDVPIVDVPVKQEDEDLVHHHNIFSHLFGDGSLRHRPVQEYKTKTMSALLQDFYLPSIQPITCLQHIFLPRRLRNSDVHCLIIDSVTAIQKESTTQHALRCETLARQEFDQFFLQNSITNCAWP